MGTSWRCGRIARAAAVGLVTVVPGLASPDSAPGQQVADTLFRPAVAPPAYPPGLGPLVLLDEAHTNFHTIDGRYRAFARLLRQDGYVVAPQTSRFTPAALDGATVLVIANALAKLNETAWTLPTPSAFDRGEIAAVRDWVEHGGSLLLIADHMPFPGAAEDLAASFGIRFANGFAMDSTLESAPMVFRRTDGSLAQHTITEGRHESERVDSVVTFTGQAFRLDGPGTPLLILPHDAVLLLPTTAWEFSDRTPRLSASHLLQGAALEVGPGRVAVFGEAAMFTAQVRGPQRVPMGMNVAAADQNPQFLLNVMHWLSRLPEGGEND